MSNSGSGTPPPKGRSDPERALEVLESNSDSSWSLFQVLQDQQQRGFAKTDPQALPPAPAARGAPQPPAQPLSVEEAMVEVRRNGRACPLPDIWQQLYDYLPGKPADLPPVPPREEWQRMSALQKRARLRQHLEWAHAQGLLRQVHDALVRLPEEMWHHLRE